MERGYAINFCIMILSYLLYKYNMSSIFLILVAKEYPKQR